MSDTHDYTGAEFDAGELNPLETGFGSFGGDELGGPPDAFDPVTGDLYGQAAEVWTDNVAGCCCAIPATDQSWGDQLYTQIVENPSQAVVWTNSAPDPTWTDITDVVADPSSVVTYPTTTTLGGPDPQFTTSVIGGPQDSIMPGDDLTVSGPGTDPVTPRDESQFITVIGGPQSTDSLNSSLISMYETAVSTGDVMSQIAIQNMLNSQSDISRLWLMPQVTVL
jgi:hypothetical protein